MGNTGFYYLSGSYQYRRNMDSLNRRFYTVRFFLRLFISAVYLLYMAFIFILLLSLLII